MAGGAGEGASQLQQLRGRPEGRTGLCWLLLFLLSLVVEDEDSWLPAA